MFEAKIPAGEHTNIMSSFWTMLRECESQADNEDDAILKHMVEGWYHQWNEVCSDNKEPAWKTRKKI